MRSRGEPITASDVVYEPVADAQNAWVLETQAMAAIVAGADSPRSSSLEYRDYPPYPQQWIKMAQSSEQANLPAFAMARQARQRNEVQIRRNLTSPVSLVLLPYLNDTRHLANLLSDGAVWAHLQGDDAEAVERIADVLHLARSVHHDDFVVSQLVAMGIDMLTCKSTHIIAPGLRFDTRSSTRPATLQKVRQLIDQLLDERPMQEGLRRSLVMERLYLIEAARLRSDGTWFIRPLADQEILGALANSSLMLKASHCTNNPQAQDLLGRCRWDKEMDLTTWATMAAGNVRPRATPRYSRWFHEPGDKSPFVRAYFRAIAERRATALALASQLFRTDHGRWANAFDELVPDYLPAVPADPFYSDGRPMGYLVLAGKLPGGGDRPLVFYGDGEDQGPTPDEPMCAWTVDQRPGHWMDAIRQYRDLAPFSLPGFASSQAVNNNPQIPDTPRQDANETEQTQEP